MLIQYVAAGILFALGAMAFETRIVHWTPDFPFALCWLVIVLSFGAIWLLYFLISRAAATRIVIYVGLGEIDLANQGDVAVFRPSPDRVELAIA